MTCYYNGELEILNGRTADEAVRQIFAKRDLNGANATGAAVRYINQFIDFNDMTVGYFLLDDLTAAVAELHALGYQMEGSVTYYGDYDGAYEIKLDGTVEQYDPDDWAVHQYDDAGLIAELERRGYTVTKARNEVTP